ncbi:hypothetical protein BGZ47_002990 [Haplosporangium gracile]|nr:hypothetical protein BGZ47_002990 [Haplosporangium gracile]
MDDFDMEEDFDFGSLTLGEFPRSSTSQSTEVLHLSDSLSAATLSDQSSAVQAQQAQAQASNTNPTTALNIATTPTSGEGGGEDATSDNGPWAKLPSAGAGDINPYLPGVTAQKLDAMAMDPHHVFKSAPPQSGDSPFSIPPPSSSSASSRDQQQKDKDKGRKQDEKTDDDKKDKIPDWMLADPELKPITDLDWSTTTMATSQKDDSLGWGDPGTFGGLGYSGADLSTTVDSNALFGFSSYPTYETLSFANAIAEEQHRKHTILASGEPYNPFSSSSSSSGGGGSGQTRTTREGGFARFGNTVRGDGQIAPVFGRRPSSSLASGSSGSGADVGSSNEHGFTWDKQDQRKNLTTGSEQQQQPQWQTWRSSGFSPQGVPDLDQLMDEDLEDDPFDEPQIK